MEFTLEELQVAIKARMEDQTSRKPCKDNTCSDCKLCLDIEADKLLNRMFENAYIKIMEEPKMIISYAVAYIQLGMAIQEAKQMEETFKL